ncbi:hypothetical protein AC231_13650 [Clostridium pasteurianum]|uniref:hypothetical protein n=1 Tax=Clostridium pasteurianum TaxID=1501 RepID=UPI0002A77D12|nr:hypothetical protein [Clostridium pasteurianum]AOZ74280.1 hypothetical protein AQ983_03845 [Clostridium pasteurianum DSM 525 = ATCC 6013]AOZ78078.1 hypothetical protein AQ984_03850 [Clostridium pasteurianum]ELP58146.1 fic family protein [Clostridium pasteurianum DSM 525 = ATCC 6013]OMH21522.1 hypothetical protein AC231_13650 [Clostridium pasteurianum]
MIGIKNNEDLLESEGILSGFRLAHLLRKPIIDGNFDLKHPQKIHKFIFQDEFYLISIEIFIRKSYNCL